MKQRALCRINATWSAFKSLQMQRAAVLEINVSTSVALLCYYFLPGVLVIADCWTAVSGYGGLSLSIEGPSKAEIECQDNEDGSCRVTYRPTEPGNYVVNVKFADEHVPGTTWPTSSPVSCCIQQSVMTWNSWTVFLVFGWALLSERWDKFIACHGCLRIFTSSLITCAEGRR